MNPNIWKEWTLGPFRVKYSSWKDVMFCSFEIGLLKCLKVELMWMK